ncbi:MAG: protein-disulfide reductase DsbD family protein, partial [Oceanospirillum sp.]|nr:protein-disulfide reductase DsbD family protein [Oceanospirillum sp.]
MSHNDHTSFRMGLKHLLFLILIATLSSISFHSMAGTSSADENFLPPDQAFKLSYEQLTNGTLQLHWEIADGYYLYQKRLKLTDENKEPLSDVALLTKAEEKNDPNFGLVQVFHHQLDVEALPHSNQLVLSYQGCSENGLCYPPQ